MERIKHIKETQKKELLDAQTDPGETSPMRDKITQIDNYNSATETHKEQIFVRETLNSLDEDTLKDIFAEYFRKAGSDEETMNWIPFDKVRIVYSSPDEQVKSNSLYGSHSIASGVELYSHLLRHDQERILWTLIHELCHAISQDIVRSNNAVNDAGEVDEYKMRAKSGVASIISTIKSNTGEIKVGIFNNEINEGVTELLTEKIFREYKKRTGSETYSQHPTQPGQAISRTDEVVAESKFGAYERNWQNTKLYISLISALADTPEDVVENAVIRTYIRNGTILPVHDSEINALLSEVDSQLPLILFSILESNKSEDDPTLKKYVDYLSRQNLPKDVIQKIVVALYKIREEWGEAYKLAPDKV